MTLSVVGGSQDVHVVDGLLATSSPGAPELDATGLLVAPGLIGLQVNGAHGVDITAEPHRLWEVVKVPIVPFSIASWEYRFEPSDGGTLVTEVWTDGRSKWPDFVTNRLDKVATGGRTFAEFKKRNIAKTLARLKQDFESR